MMNFDRLRKEYNAMLMEKAANGSGMIRDMYITITVVRKNYEEAKNFFTRVGAELNMHLSRLGSRCTELSAEDRLLDSAWFLPSRRGGDFLRSC